MDTSQLETLVPGLGAFSAFSVAVILLIRLLGHDRAQLVAADERYKQEVADHEKTQAELDQERDLRRKAEDSVAGLARKVEALTEQVERQTKQIADQSDLVGRQTEQISKQSEQISKQTERITHLEQEVARLKGATAA